MALKETPILFEPGKYFTLGPSRIYMVRDRKRRDKLRVKHPEEIKCKRQPKKGKK